MKITIYILTVVCSFQSLAQTNLNIENSKSYYEGVSVPLAKGIDNNQLIDLASKVRPSARQLRWQQYGMLGFVHFNINSFTGVEWGSGKEDLSIFNPKELDTHQWIKTFKSTGINAIILVAKHHDGFRLWPSEIAERTIAKTPYKNGKGNIVREFIDACREEGIAVCLYYSPWDKHEPYGKPEYNDLMVAELTDLLTNYGNINLLWFDGAGMDEKTSGKKMVFDWARIYKTIRTLQPQALISGAAPDIRWVGNEGGRGRFTEWSVQGIDLSEKDFSGYDSGVPLTAKNLGSIDQLKDAVQLAWYPARGGLPLRHGWFWHPKQKTRTLGYIVKSYFETVGQNSNLLVNLSPDNRGLIPDSEVVRMREFGDYLEQMYKRDYGAGATAISPSTRKGGYHTNYLFDNDLRTCWVAPENESSGEIIVNLYKEQSFNVIKLQENIVDFGQRIEAFEVDVWENNAWKTISKATTVGFRRLLRIPFTTTDKLRIRILDSRNSPSLASLNFYQSPSIINGPEVVRNASGSIQIVNNSKEELQIKYTVDGSDPLGGNGIDYNRPFELSMGGVVRAVYTKNKSNEYFIESSQMFAMLPIGWELIKKHDALLDNDQNTSVDFNLKKGSMSSFSISFKKELELSGIGYIPSQQLKEDHGHVESYRIYQKMENGSWEKVISGSFGNIENNPILQKVYFDSKIKTTAIKFEIIKATKKQKKVSISEFKIYK